MGLKKLIKYQKAYDATKDLAERAQSFGWPVVGVICFFMWSLPVKWHLSFSFWVRITITIAFGFGLMSLFLALVMTLFSSWYLYPRCSTTTEQLKCKTRVAKLWDKAQKLETERIAAMIELWELQDSLQRERMDIEEMKWLDAPPELDVLPKSDVLRVDG